MQSKRESLHPKNKQKPLRSLLNFQNLAFLIVIAIFVISVVWSEPISHLFSGINLQDTMVKATATTLPGTPTPLPLKYYSTPDQTNGILLGVIVLAVIILGGTLGVIILDKAK